MGFPCVLNSDSIVSRFDLRERRSMDQAVKITRARATSAELRRAASKCNDGAHVRRLLALAPVLDDRSRRWSIDVHKSTIGAWLG